MGVELGLGGQGDARRSAGYLFFRPWSENSRHLRPLLEMLDSDDECVAVYRMALEAGPVTEKLIRQCIEAYRAAQNPSMWAAAKASESVRPHAGRVPRLRPARQPKEPPSYTGLAADWREHLATFLTPDLRTSMNLVIEHRADIEDTVRRQLIAALGQVSELTRRYAAALADGLPPTAEEPKATPKPKPAPKPKKPATTKTPAQVQAELRAKFDRWSAPTRFSREGPPLTPERVVYDRGPEQIEIRRPNILSTQYIGVVIKDGKAEYRRVPLREMQRRIKAVEEKPYRDARARRIRDLHPDKLGREQTPEERAEYTELTR